MKALTKIQITDDNGIKFFGEGPCRLLRGVERTGSLRAAAAEMEMAYSKASKLLKQSKYLTISRCKRAEDAVAVLGRGRRALLVCALGVVVNSLNH